MAAFREEQEQKELRTAYGIEDKEVVVVERRSRIVMIWKATLKYFFVLLRIAASVALAVLAVTGLAALVFPEVRIPLFETLAQAFSQLKQFLGF